MKRDVFRYPGPSEHDLKNTLRVTATVTLFACAGSGTARAAQDLDWIVAPYLWVPTITVDVATQREPGDPSGAGEDVFPDVLDELDGAFLAYAEAQADRWGGSVNLLYLGLESDEPFEVARTSSDLDATIVDAAVVYSFGPERFRGFELYGGLRYVNIDYRADVDFTNPALATRALDIGDSYYDFLLGARWRQAFAQRWAYALEADGSTGGTEGTFSASARLLYSMKRGAWAFGWRYLYGEIEPGRNRLDIELNGALVGYAFAF